MHTSMVGQIKVTLSPLSVWMDFLLCPHFDRAGNGAEVLTCSSLLRKNSPQKTHLILWDLQSQMMTAQSDSDVYFFLFFSTVERERPGKELWKCLFSPLSAWPKQLRAWEQGRSAVQRNDRTLNKGRGKKGKTASVFVHLQKWAEREMPLERVRRLLMPQHNSASSPWSPLASVQFVFSCFTVVSSLCVRATLLWLLWPTAVCGPDGRPSLISCARFCTSVSTCVGGGARVLFQIRVWEQSLCACIRVCSGITLKINP